MQADRAVGQLCVAAPRLPVTEGDDLTVKVVKRHRHMKVATNDQIGGGGHRIGVKLPKPWSGIGGLTLGAFLLPLVTQPDTELPDLVGMNQTGQKPDQGAPPEFAQA